MIFIECYEYDFILPGSFIKLVEHIRNIHIK